jgi:hypothetical protein
MSNDHSKNLRVQLGYFQGEVPAETLAAWRTILNVPIYVHESPLTGIKTYSIFDFPEGYNLVTYAQFLKENGIAGASSILIYDGDKIQKGWEGYLVIGPEVAVLAPINP